MQFFLGAFVFFCGIMVGAALVVTTQRSLLDIGDDDVDA